jgi:hypothetical protein
MQEFTCKSYDLMLHSSILAFNNQFASKIIIKLCIYQALCEKFSYSVSQSFELLALLVGCHEPSLRFSGGIKIFWMLLCACRLDEILDQ